MKKIFLLGLLLLLACPVAAETVDTYPFKTAQQEQQFNYLSQQFRCLVCQNQTLADSNAPLANDLRTQIAEMVRKGSTNEEIIHYLKLRYGDFVLFRPPINTETFVLWFAPFIFLIIGILSLCFYIKGRAKNKEEAKL